jgi:hypothetical protein
MFHEVNKKWLQNVGPNENYRVPSVFLPYMQSNPNVGPNENYRVPSVFLPYMQSMGSQWKRQM